LPATPAEAWHRALSRAVAWPLPVF